MDGQLAAEFMPTARCFNGIDITDKVGDGDIRRVQLFNIPLFGREISDRSCIPMFAYLVVAALADRRIRVVMNLASRNVGHLLIEKRGKRAQYPAFRLAAQAQENEIVSRQNRIHDLRYHGIVVADDPGENGATLT